MNACTCLVVTGDWRLLVGWAALADPGDDRSGSGPRAPTYPDHTRLLVVRDGEGRERPVAGREDWDVRRAHILAHFQEVAGPLPGGERRVPLDVQVVSTAPGAGLRPQEDHVRDRAGRPRAGLAADPRWAESGRRGPRGAPPMLCLHQTVAIGKDEPVGLGGNPDLRYAMELARRGYVAIAPDYPGFGEYKIDVYKLGYASATMKAIWNNLRAVDVLCGLEEVDADRIGVIGHSLGGHNAIFTALFEPRIRAVVSSCGFNAFPSYYKGNIAGWSHKGYMPRLRERYQLDLAQGPLRLPRADRRPGPAGVLHQLAAARRQLRGRRGPRRDRRRPAGLPAPGRPRPTGRGLSRRPTYVPASGSGAGLCVPRPALAGGPVSPDLRTRVERL